jgi:hypothetical protein
MESDPAEKAKGVRAQRLLYLLMVVMIVVPVAIFVLRSYF